MADSIVDDIELTARKYSVVWVGSCVTAFGTPPGKCLELARVKITARR